MRQKRQHIKEEHRLPEEWEKVAGKTQSKFNKSKETVWADMKEQMDEQPEETKVIQMNWLRYAAAAVLVLALTSASFLRLYTETVMAPVGEHASALLPDGTKVQLNAASEINYHPYWWRFQREVNFEGEAFFEVEKGSAFSVISERGTTQVLGTSFNINSRHGGYQVYCKTGKVNVSNKQSQVTLQPDQLALSDNGGNLLKSIANNEDELIGWMNNRMVFNSQLLTQVIHELELQFDVSIEFSDPSLSDLKFTGSFTKPNHVKEALDVIGSSLNLEFKQTSTRTYLLLNSMP